MEYIKSESYKSYRDSQIKTTSKKLSAIWISDEEIDLICDYVKHEKIDVKFGICHGARNGYEVKYFAEGLNADIIGTDISPVVTKIPLMEVWDFHDMKEEWRDAVDFIYSNSIDHSYDFNTALDTWMECLTRTGRCFIQWEKEMSKPFNNVDCFGVGFDELVNIINEKYEVETVLEFVLAERYKGITIDELIKIIVIKHREK